MSLLLPILLLAAASLCASMPLRDPKNLPYFEYLPEEYYEMPMDGNDISRTIPKRKPLNPYNSPIYYIRLPPQPYMFVPGLGYISQPPPPPPVPAMSPFVPLPIDFVANGKPSNIYQWAAGVGGFNGQGAGQRPQRPHRPQKPQGSQKPQQGDSTVHNLDGEFNFNGKPNDNVFVLRDSYNALYGDALQNFYP